LCVPGERVELDREALRIPFDSLDSLTDAISGSPSSEIQGRKRRVSRGAAPWRCGHWFALISDISNVDCVGCSGHRVSKENLCVPGVHLDASDPLFSSSSQTSSPDIEIEVAAGRCRDVQLGKTTVNWKQRALRFLHLVLAIENTPVFIRCSAQVANGAQMEHTFDAC
jgi:hypothetical protein